MIQFPSPFPPPARGKEPGACPRFVARQRAAYRRGAFSSVETPAALFRPAFSPGGPRVTEADGKLLDVRLLEIQLDGEVFALFLDLDLLEV